MRPKEAEKTNDRTAPCQGMVRGTRLTVAPSGKKRHPVDGDRNGAMLIVKMVDVVRGAETGRHTCRPGLDGERGEQGEPEGQSRAVTQAHAWTKAGPAAGRSERRGGCSQVTHGRQVHDGPVPAARPRFSIRQFTLRTAGHLSDNLNPFPSL